MSKYRDLVLDTPNPAALDETLQQMGAALIGGGGPHPAYERIGDHYVARCLGDPGYIRFAVEAQGYAQVVGWLDELPEAVTPADLGDPEEPRT